MILFSIPYCPGKITSSYICIVLKQIYRKVCVPSSISHIIYHEDAIGNHQRAQRSSTRGRSLQLFSCYPLLCAVAQCPEIYSALLSDIFICRFWLPRSPSLPHPQDTAPVVANSPQVRHTYGKPGVTSLRKLLLSKACLQRLSQRHFLPLH